MTASANQTPFTTVMTVSPSRENLSRDRRALRQAGVPAVITKASLEEALAWLADNSVDLLILDSDLGRTSGARVLKLLRRRRSYAALPVIIAGTDGSRAAVLEAMAAGCSGFLVRPYSQDALTRQCQLAAQSSQPDPERQNAMELARKALAAARPRRAINAMKRAVANEDEARQHYVRGCEHLTAERFELAINAFNKAVALNTLFAEAYIGMANAWDGLGEPQKAKECMRRAVDAHARNNAIARTRETLARILKDHPDATNPFLDLGFSLVRKGEFQAAGQAYALGLQHSPTSGQAFAAMTRACLFTDTPADAARAVARAMAEAGAPHSPETLFRRIMGDLPPAQGAATRARTAARPEMRVMNDIWAVLKVTWKLYRNGGPIEYEPLPLPPDF